MIYTFKKYVESIENEICPTCGGDKSTHDDSYCCSDKGRYDQDNLSKDQIKREIDAKYRRIFGKKK
jgi:hypothetical protein